jgi:hypothetical protein
MRTFTEAVLNFFGGFSLLLTTKSLLDPRRIVLERNGCVCKSGIQTFKMIIQGSVPLGSCGSLDLLLLEQGPILMRQVLLTLGPMGQDGSPEAVPLVLESLVPKVFDHCL